MNILIIGATGLLGNRLSLELAKNNRIWGISRTKNDIFLHENINLIEEDLRNLDYNSLPKNIDTIYYVAQSRAFRDFPNGAEDMFQINVATPLKLIDWAINNKVKQFIYASSGGVYSNPTQPVKEFFQVNANDVIGFYLSSKLSAEVLLRNYFKYFETFIIARPFFIYGPRQESNMLLPRLIKNVEEGIPLKLNGKEGIKINPIYVDDAALAFSKLIALKGNHIINIAGKEIVSLKQLGEIIGKVIDKKPMFKIVEQKSNDLVADISLMETKLCLPKVSLREGLKSTYRSLINTP